MQGIYLMIQIEQFGYMASLVIWKLMHLHAEDLRKPIHAFFDPSAVDHRASNNTPISISQLAQLKCFGDLSGSLCTGL